MRITFAVPELKTRVAKLAQVVAKKSEEALYKNVRIFTEGDFVYLQGIDIDTTMTLKLTKATADEPVNILVDFSILKDIVPALSDAQATITTKTGAEAVLSSGKFRARLTVFPIEKFIELPLVQAISDRPEIGNIVFGLPGLKEQIELVDFGVPAAEGRHVVASALIESTGASLNVVATNGFVIAISTTPSAIGEFSFPVPKPALDLLKSLEGDQVTISDTEAAFYFKTELEVVTYNKTHSVFPDYKRVTPKEALPKTITIKSKDEFLSAIARVKPLCITTADNKEKPVNIECIGNELSLKAVREDKVATGDTYMDMGLDNITVEGTGGDFKIKLDINKYLPFIEKASFPITLSVSGPTKVVDFHGLGSTFENPLYRLLVMPMRGVEGVSSTPIPA